MTSGARLLMVSGSSSGAGKSTLSAAVAEALVRAGRGVRCLTEDDLLDRADFGRFERSLGPTDPGTHRADLALLDAAAALVQEAEARAEREGAPEYLVTDAVLPGFFWLFGRYDAAQVRETADRLADVLAPLEPLLVYLRGDPAALVARAATERGSDWPALMAARVARWTLPHYPGRPVRDLDDAIALFRWLDERTLELLDGWRVPSVVFDARQPHPDLIRPVLGRL